MLKTSKGKFVGYGLVINKDGMPKISNPKAVPDEVWQSLTQQQKDFANANVSANLKRLGD